ncbi:hypothetical protein sscle_01g010200 [Sclerotinia sclerotiorum 1980 UF-70]|uniref:Uncharacterized protein n=1 Tax=Sclerotinia sclerotiorum (strain ATCC 18683 / 1980 / Ss-1) TaxID=665079 RepID=A0A1D9PUB1_SCLS1|nr:hypothetical protein sscle_01g010200 [Sclerotinia sclerotiorum 1980 UF-70]
MDTQKVHATTGSMPSNMAKSEKYKTTLCCHVFKTPLPKYRASPPGAAHSTRVTLPKERQKNEPCSPTPDGSRRKNHNRNSLAARTKMISHDFENMAFSYHNVNKQYRNSIGEAHHHNDDKSANGSVPNIQFHGTSKKSSSTIVLQIDHITSNSTNVLDSEEPFCQMNKAEWDEEASFW